MTSKTYTDTVLVAGAGPVGLLAAGLLRRRGVDVTVLERASEPQSASYAVPLHGSSLGLLDELGLADDLVRAGEPVDRVSFWEEGRERASVDLTRLSGAHPGLLMVSQRALSSALEARTRLDGVKMAWNCRVSAVSTDGASATVQTERLGSDSVGYAVSHNELVVESVSELTVPFALGADGHDSMLRNGLDIAYDEIGRPDCYAVFEFDAILDLRREMRVAFGRGSNDVLRPSPGGRWCWTFQVESTEKPRKTTKPRPWALLQETDIDDPYRRLDALISERAPWFQGSVRSIHGAKLVTSERRLATRFQEGACFLAGDAAHLSGPLAGHSLNSGLSEAADLARLIGGRMTGEAHTTAAPDYGPHHQGEWRFLLGLAGGLTPDATTDTWVAEHRRRLLSCLPATGGDLVALVRQLGLSVKR